MDYSDRDRLVNEILEHFMIIRRRIAERRHSVMPLDCSVPPAQAIMLHIIDCHTNLSVKEIAEHMHVSGSAITQMVDPLVKADLLRRETDESDRRVSRISLTEAGKGMVDQLKKFHVEEMGRMLEPLDESELLTFRNTLGKILGA